MPSTLASEAISSLPNNTQRKRWTRVEVDALESAGLLQQERLELIEGELILKMGKNRPHILSLALVMKYFIDTFSYGYIQSEGSIDVHPEDLPTSEPEPDLVVLRQPLAEFTQQNPRPEQIHLVCEISHSTLAFDLSKKADLYARAAIEEYWVIDLINRRLIVHRSPMLNGYASVQVFSTSELIAPLAAPNALVPVATFFSDATI